MLQASSIRRTDQTMRFAEVIGDPIAQSKSPIIHHHWLALLAMAGEYRRTHVPAASLVDFLERRGGDPLWRGCNVTIPHKEVVLALVDCIDPPARAIGAINCIIPKSGQLVGYNTDIDGIALALGSADIAGKKIVLIGAGGAARAVITYATERGAGQIGLVARNPKRAEKLKALAPGAEWQLSSLDQPEPAFDGATLIVNASPLGMAGAEPMPATILEQVADKAINGTVFDMVTTPSTTDLLEAGKSAGASCVDGLTMLVGQAGRAFELFFGRKPPPPDRLLLDLLGSGTK